MTPSPLRILIVDANRDAADSLAALITHWGHDVVTAYTSEQALDTATRFRPDLVFTELFLDILNGCQLAKELKQVLSNVVLVLLTCLPLAYVRGRSDRDALDFYLPKLGDLDFLGELLAGIAARRTVLLTAEVVAVRPVPRGLTEGSELEAAASAPLLPATSDAGVS